MCKWAIQNGCGGDQGILFVCEVEPVSVCVFFLCGINSFLSLSVEIWFSCFSIFFSHSSLSFLLYSRASKPNLSERRVAKIILC